MCQRPRVARDYKNLNELIQRFEASTFTMSQPYAELLSINLQQDSAQIGSYLKRRLEKNTGLHAIIKMENQELRPALYADLQLCQPTTASVERSFSILTKMLRKVRPFLPGLNRSFLINSFWKLFFLLEKF